MKDFYKKEKPLQGISGWGGGATGLRMAGGMAGPSYDDPGQQAYTTPGTYTWVGGKNTITVSMLAVSGGAGGSRYPLQQDSAGGGGGGLRYANNVDIEGGADYTIVVGSGGDTTTNSHTSTDRVGGSSYVEDSDGTKLVLVTGGRGFSDGTSDSGKGGGDWGTNVGDGGGNGGAGGYWSSWGRGGGGGAGGYSGDGGEGGSSTDNGASGSGGGGGGGGGGRSDYGGEGSGGGGGGVGILGEGSSGSGGTSRAVDAWGPAPRGQRGHSGSGGEAKGGNTDADNANSEGSYYGGGAGGQSSVNNNPAYDGGDGAVRLIWPGDARQFPSTRTADE